MMTASLTVLNMVTQIMLYSVTLTNESPSPTSTRPLRKIPGAGISWLKQRQGGYLYADKSIYLERILDNREGNIFFYMTRPRRFGKTSFLEMAQHFFNGNDTLFDGLRIGNRGNADFFKKPEDGGVPEELRDKKWIQCPVIYLDFNKLENFSSMTEFHAFYTQSLQNIAKSYRLEDDVLSTPDLIFHLEFKFKIKVVVLIDGYDSPLQNALEKKKDRALAMEIRYFLEGLFGAIKSEIENLRLVLILGVWRLDLTTGLQSGPNNYVDLTYKEEFAGAFGFTSEEMKDFHPEIKDRFNLTSKEGINEFLDQLRKDYDGYNYTFQYEDGKKKNVLNPLSTMKCLENKKFGCYWSETSNVNDKVIRRLYFLKEPLQAFEHRKLSRDDIEAKHNLPMESIRIEILMLVYGYFTIESYDEKTEDVVLNFPNEEIKTALQKNIDKYKPNDDVFLSDERGWLYELRWHMENGHPEGTMDILRNLFNTDRSSETLRQGTNDEFSTTARLIDTLRVAGIFCHRSVEFMKENSSQEKGGHVDVFVLTAHLEKNYVMSIKCGQSATTAIEQLINYLREQRTRFLEAIDEPDEAWFVGMNFDSRTGGTLLREWIGIPFKNGVLYFEQCKASLPELCRGLLNKNANQS